jgi:membrane protein insertase Oxa1/YidC/SpoIIIJ
MIVIVFVILVVIVKLCLIGVYKKSINMLNKMKISENELKRILNLIKWFSLDSDEIELYNDQN